MFCSYLIVSVQLNIEYYTDLNPSPDRIKHPTVFYFFTELG